MDLTNACEMRRRLCLCDFWVPEDESRDEQCLIHNWIMIGAENGEHEMRMDRLVESFLNSGGLFIFMSKKAYLKQGIVFDL
jgi:hypothetical protein